jgi:hypothetical protein
MPGFTVTWICEIGWVFALLYDLPWLALVFAFLACIALFAAWYTSVALSAIGLEFGDHHDTITDPTTMTTIPMSMMLFTQARIFCHA